LKHRLSTAIALVFVAVALGGGFCFAEQRFKIPDGATAKALDGKTVSLEDHKGKLVFLTIWSTDCKACIYEIPILNKLQEEYSTKNFTIVGLSIDRGKDDLVRKVVKTREINYPIWLGYGQPLSQYTRTEFLPTLFAIGPEGEVLGYLIGAFASYEQAVEAVDRALALIDETKSAE